MVEPVVSCSDLPTSGDDGEFQRAWGPGVDDTIEQRLCYCRYVIKVVSSVTD